MLAININALAYLMNVWLLSHQKLIHIQHIRLAAVDATEHIWMEVFQSLAIFCSSHTFQSPSNFIGQELKLCRAEHFYFGKVVHLHASSKLCNGRSSCSNRRLAVMLPGSQQAAKALLL